jgi:hypothetical protein
VRDKRRGGGSEKRAEDARQGGTLRFIGTAALCAVALGLVIISATVLGVDALRSSHIPNPNPLFYLIVGGTLAGILAAAGAAWWLLGPIESTYRRGALAMVCGFATVLFMLLCIPMHQLLGRPGLLALLGLSIIASAVLGVRARRLGAGT